MSRPINGFSKLSKTEKINWIAQFLNDPAAATRDFNAWQHPDAAIQRVIDGFTENAVSNYVLPHSRDPHFLINGRH